MKEKILFTTAIKDDYDYFQVNSRSILSPRLPRFQSIGLRFLKQNLPEIKILEYPTKKQFIKKLKEGWDIVGFSFFLNETEKIKKMIGLARNEGVKEIWGGNYGVLTPAIQEYFDRIFIGEAEKTIGGIINKPIDDINHPPLVWYMGAPFFLKIRHFGILFTSRGCKYRCSFCQTSLFIKKPELLSLESIEKVLRYYKKLSIPSILILDENFGIFEEHTNRVVELLKKYKFSWAAMTSIRYLKNNLEKWHRAGLYGALVGLENLSPDNLKSISKFQNKEEIFELMRMAKEKIFVLGFYMIGFENDTPDSIENDFKELLEIGCNFYQLCVLTPLPQTRLWNYLDDKYGIFEKDFRKFDTKNLVWNHPSISPQTMKHLLEIGLRTLNPPKRTLRLLGPLKGGKLHYLNHLIKANLFNYKYLPLNY